MSDLDRQASGVHMFEDDRDADICKTCGASMEWAECYMIDCEEGYYDLGEEDCINYDPGTYVKCGECNGDGGWFFCPNCATQSDPSLPAEGSERLSKEGEHG